MESKLIVCGDNISFGAPPLRGRRLTVYDIVTKLYSENTITEALEDYDLTLIEAKAAIEYCMKLHCQIDTSRIHYCNGCILRSIEEKWSFKKDDYIQIEDKLTITKEGSVIILGSIENLEEESFGKPG